MASRCIKSISVASSGYADRYVVNSSVHRPRACRPRVPMPPAKWSRTAALGEDEICLAKRDYGWPEDAKFLVPDVGGITVEGDLGQDGGLLPDGILKDTDKQHSGICQGGVTPPQPRGPMPAAGRDVTEVVCGVIRQQRYRMRRQAKNDFLRFASDQV